MILELPIDIEAKINKKIKSSIRKAEKFRHFQDIALLAPFAA